MADHSQQSQQFVSAPRVVGNRSKYREGHANNIMHDRRVHRGSTYASLVMPNQPDAAQVEKQREAQHRRLMRANKAKRRATTPEPVLGRKHMDIQTDSYLEELTDRIVEFEAEAQTDFLLDRPQSPLFMPAKVGTDVGTTIEHGELFDFDCEVEPVLEVIVGKTLEQSMMEVLEEEELAAIMKHQEDFENRRQAELLEVQRMEAAEVRRMEEMNRRLAQTKAKAQADTVIFKKVKSRNFSREYLAGLTERVLEEFSSLGMFADPFSLSVEAQFMPWLVESVCGIIADQRAYQAAASSILDEGLAAAIKPHEEAVQNRRDVQREKDDAELKYRKTLIEMQQLQEKAAARIEQEREAMQAWENQEENEPEYIITALSEDLVVSVQGPDGSSSEASIAPELAEELKGYLEQEGTVKCHLSDNAVVSLSFQPKEEAE